MILGIVSGYFSPLHYGHIEYFIGAKNQCDKLMVIVNNDFQSNLKGCIPFIDENHRVKIIENLKMVDFVFLSIDKDKTVCNSIRHIKNLYNSDELKFFNSGDRIGNNLEPTEKKLCEELGIKYIELHLEKIYSSSEILKKVYEFQTIR